LCAFLSLVATKSKHRLDRNINENFFSWKVNEMFLSDQELTSDIRQHDVKESGAHFVWANIKNGKVALKVHRFPLWQISCSRSKFPLLWDLTAKKLPWNKATILKRLDVLHNESDSLGILRIPRFLFENILKLHSPQ